MTVPMNEVADRLRRIRGKWALSYLEGIGNNVEIEFVDPSGSGEYHMTMDPSERMRCCMFPGAGF